MHDCPKYFSAAIGGYRTRAGQRAHLSLRALVCFAAAIAWSNGGAAQDIIPPGADLPPAMGAAGVDPGMPPVTQSGDVSFFSQDLGTILRLQFRTESYGQDGNGNFDIGTMQVVTLDDTSAFLDGQVTVNESDGVGFNVGLGYRWMSYPEYSAHLGRMQGVSLWADGTHTDAGNFFPQVGVSLESLGETWEFRANGYVPVGQQEQVGAFKSTGGFNFTGNSLNEATQAIVDRSFYAGDLEIARRMGPHRDAWAFAGPYFVANDEDDSAGIRAGVRGYAYPDLLLQFTISDDDVFKTNATFSVVWFVGRTRTNFQPSCTPADNFRSHVLRNDYVVLSHTKRAGGTALTNPDGTALRIVHVDSNVGAGGDGTVEHPFNELTDVNGGGSQTGDVILAHSTSVFNGESSVNLKDNQKLFGEGNNLEIKVATKEDGNVTLPESSPGARALARPKILAALGDAIVLADSNEVANFDMDGQGVTARGIVAPAAGAGNPNIHDMTIKNTTGDAIHLTPFSFIDVNDTDGDTNTTETIVHGNVTIDKVTLENVGGNGVDITATTADVTQPNFTLQETLKLTNITSTDGAGRGIAIRGTHTGRTTTLSNYTYDGGTTSAGGIQLDNFDGSLTASTSTLTGGLSTSQGAQILGDSDGTINFQSSVVFNSMGGTAVDINGDVGGANQIGGTINISGNITDSAVTSASVQGIAATGQVNFSGAIASNAVTHSGDGIFINSNATGAQVGFTGRLTIKSTADGFVAQNAGTIRATSTTSSIEVTDGQALVITDTTIASNGVLFGDINRTAASTLRAIDLERNTGGSIAIGNTTDAVGDAGTITSGTNEAIFVQDSANVAITGLIINNTAAATGVSIQKTTNDAMTVDLNDLETNDGTKGVAVEGNDTTGALNLTVNDTTVNNATSQGMSFDLIAEGTTQVNRATVNAPAADAFVVTNVADITFDTAHVVSANDGVTLTHNGAATTPMDVTLNALTVDAVSNVGVLVTAGSTQDFALKFTASDVTGPVLMTNSAAGKFGLLIDSTDINRPAGGDTLAIVFSGAATSGDVTIRNQNNITAGNGRALFIDTAGNPTVRLLVEDSTFINNSAFNAAVINGRGTSISQVTVQGNTFRNDGAGKDFSMDSQNTANVNLNLGGSGADKNTAAGSTTYLLNEGAGSDFKLFDQPGTTGNLRNFGTVVATPLVTDFDNLLVPPPLPTVPP